MFKQIIVLCFVFIVLCKAENQSNCSRSEFDEQFSKIVGLFGVKGVDFPTTDEEVDKYCRYRLKKTKINMLIPQLP